MYILIHVHTQSPSSMLRGAEKKQLNCYLSGEFPLMTVR